MVESYFGVSFFFSFLTSNYFRLSFIGSFKVENSIWFQPTHPKSQSDQMKTAKALNFHVLSDLFWLLQLCAYDPQNFQADRISFAVPAEKISVATPRKASETTFSMATEMLSCRATFLYRPGCMHSSSSPRNRKSAETKDGDSLLARVVWKWVIKKIK